MDENEMFKRRQRSQGFLCLVAMLLAIAFLLPTPALDELNHTVGKVASVSVTKNEVDLQLELDTKEKKVALFVYDLTLQEMEVVKSLSPGTELEVWYWDPPFGLELDVWQIKQRSELVLPHENRLSSYRFTRNSIIALAVFVGIIGIFPYMRFRRAN